MNNFLTSHPKFFAFAFVFVCTTLSACDKKDAIPEDILRAYETRASAMCDCMKMTDKEKAQECRKKLDDVPAPDTQPKQDVSKESWSALRGFRDVYTKCRMGVNSMK